ncbi:DNA methyltransferase [Mycobacterium phage Phayonce]|uniref:Uncharacterized protein n=1 Tax=Mycobacterium phage Phayonce TaxID=1647302 RepID=A0A0F6YRT1_9CAUD|nr:DNA methyltransferase [Mycobacterium phage Phayonce]AKF14418.1 hypothetical protein SEA_PHAYONCE_58 [Mycobacterium phage Phayonce]
MSDRIETIIRDAHTRWLNDPTVDVNPGVLILAALKANRIALVELPESDGKDADGQEYFGDFGIRVDHSGGPHSEHPRIYIDGRPSTPERARDEAADLLAAAAAAEVSGE